MAVDILSFGVCLFFSIGDPIGKQGLLVYSRILPFPLKNLHWSLLDQNTGLGSLQILYHTLLFAVTRTVFHIKCNYIVEFFVAKCCRLDNLWRVFPGYPK